MLRFFARSFLTLALAFASISPAWASSDKAQLDVIGFSPDGRFFAFEQSGTLPQSHQGYAELYVVDTNSNAWVVGTPIKIRSHEQQGGVKHALDILDDQSARLLRRLGLNRAIEGVAFVPKDKTSLAFSLPWGEAASLRLMIRGDLAAPGCPLSIPMLRGAVQGFHLLLQRPTIVSVLYSDKMVPRERGCVLSYGFMSAYTKMRGNEAILAAIISYQEKTSHDDERTRYMAITSIVSAPRRL